MNAIINWMIRCNWVQHTSTQHVLSCCSVKNHKYSQTKYISMWKKQMGSVYELAIKVIYIIDKERYTYWHYVSRLHILTRAQNGKEQEVNTWLCVHIVLYDWFQFNVDMFTVANISTTEVMMHMNSHDFSIYLPLYYYWRLSNHSNRFIKWIREPLSRILEYILAEP